ncbi:30S ribosomal protein S21 [Allomuricauda sp. d1]|uniref:30S ribosomal protein S21 n=1 Tax=Allomuricauda sp. d1 TaxID=3136725 RepID=UPI0031D01702
MLKIQVKPDEKIERALKRYKRKRKRTQVMDKIKDNQYFEKNSVTKRKELEKAKYKQQYLNEQRDD